MHMAEYKSEMQLLCPDSGQDKQAWSKDFEKCRLVLRLFCEKP